MRKLLLLLLTSLWIISLVLLIISLINDTPNWFTNHRLALGIIFLAITSFFRFGYNQIMKRTKVEK